MDGKQIKNITVVYRTIETRNQNVNFVATEENLKDMLFHLGVMDLDLGRDVKIYVL